MWRSRDLRDHRDHRPEHDDRGERRRDRDTRHHPAHALELDPVAFRKANVLRDGREQAVGTVVRDAGFEACLDAVAARMRWSEPFAKGEGTVKRGRGVALGFKALIAPTTAGCFVRTRGHGHAHGHPRKGCGPPDHWDGGRCVPHGRAQGHNKVKVRDHR